VTNREGYTCIVSLTEYGPPVLAIFLSSKNYHVHMVLQHVLRRKIVSIQVLTLYLHRDILWELQQGLHWTVSSCS